MKKNGILNREISAVLARLGHTDKVVIADCGLPVPNHVACIDISLEKGVPGFLQVFKILLTEMEVESFTFAEEIKVNNRTLYEEISTSVTDKETVFVPHEIFKNQTSEAKVIIRTGEATPFANVILHAGVIF